MVESVGSTSPAGPTSPAGSTYLPENTWIGTASSAAFGTRGRIGPGALANIDGISVGHAADGDTGVTVIAAPAGARAAVDVRGGGPGTRETDLLAAENTVEYAHAVVLAGGSAFGLAAADGVMQGLRRRNLGFQVTPRRPEILVPIVPSAVIFDLLLGAPTIPTAELGAQAMDAALGPHPAPSHSATKPASTELNELASGSVGAGTGAAAGAIKGGFGQARVEHPSGLYVAAAVVVNSFGAVIGPDGRLYALDDATPASESALQSLAQTFVGRTKVLVADVAPGASDDAADLRGASRNTTIGCLITNASASPGQLKRLAMCGHDGLARAVRPAHAPMDGDTLFGLSTATPQSPDGRVEATETVALLSAMAADAVQCAIADGVLSAQSRAGVPALQDLV